MTQTDKADDSEIPSFDFEKQMSALQEAMKTFQRERSPQKFSKSVSTIQFYCTKILGDPTNQAFRAISKDNRRYKDYVQFVEGAPDILEALGFALKRNKLVLYLYEEDSTPYRSFQHPHVIRDLSLIFSGHWFVLKKLPLVFWKTN